MECRTQETYHIRFEALTGIVVERDEGLARARLLRANIQTDAFAAVGIAVLVAETRKDLGGGMALLTGRVGIGAEDLLDKGRACLGGYSLGSAWPRISWILRRE